MYTHIRNTHTHIHTHLLTQIYSYTHTQSEAVSSAVANQVIGYSDEFRIIHLEIIKPENLCQFAIAALVSPSVKGDRFSFEIRASQNKNP